MTSRTDENDQSGEDAADSCCCLAMDTTESLYGISTNDETITPTNETRTTQRITQKEALETEVIPELESPELEIGDHVYQWRSLLGVPYIFQHHGIVMDIIKDEKGEPVRLTIADFSNVETKGTEKKDKSLVGGNRNNVESSKGSSQNSEDDLIIKDPSQNAETEISNTATQTRSSRLFSSRRVSLDLEQEGLVRTYTDTDKWHKVHYQSGFWKRQLNRSGTVTSAKSDPVGLVLARVNFIMQHPDKLPDYHVLHANCECVAFWCKTGNWSTLQASSFLELTAAG